MASADSIHRAVGMAAMVASIAIVSCQSSARYGTPAYAGAAVGVAAAGAAANRAMGGCLAECVAGTHCNRATGLCEHGEAAPVVAATPSPTRSKARKHAQASVTSESYPPGHEYVVPALGAGDAGCDPASVEPADAGAVACEMDGGGT